MRVCRLFLRRLRMCALSSIPTQNESSDECKKRKLMLVRSLSAEFSPFVPQEKSLARVFNLTWDDGVDNSPTHSIVYKQLTKCSRLAGAAISGRAYICMHIRSHIAHTHIHTTARDIVFAHVIIMFRATSARQRAATRALEIGEKSMNLFANNCGRVRFCAFTSLTDAWRRRCMCGRPLSQSILAGNLSEASDFYTHTNVA